MKIETGCRIMTPRFCTVRIERIYDSMSDARTDGYTEPTYADADGYDIRGKHEGTNRMTFAAIRKH